ncbi:MAG: LacI family DNA-binding transcriptional regulator [Verrucomicrobiaceae bacterium]|nr:MAG: LacI family DNA-binding transcriptional regulator [Verrucomicrobiaceae bacterium]
MCADRKVPRGRKTTKAPSARSAPLKEKIRPRVTLRDIAEKLGVSRMTVSLALRDDPHVAKATKRKVKFIARKLGFFPDSKVSRLMSELALLRSTPAYRGELAFLTSWQSEFGWKNSYHFSGCHQGAEQRALELGYRLTIFWTRDPIFTSKRLSNVLWARGIKGLLIAPLGPEMISFPDVGLDIDWRRFSVVHIGATLLRPQVNMVRHNHFHGMLYSLQRLEALGYRRIGFAIVQAGDMLTSRLWTASYLHWRVQRGFQKDLPGFIYTYGSLPKDRFQNWICDHEIEAVIAMEGEPYPILKRVQKSLSRHVGFSVLDHPGGKSPFCGIEQNAPEIGRVAVDQLVHAINHNLTGLPEFPYQTLISGCWHEGATTRKFRDRGSPPFPAPISFLTDHF